jgi:tetratricopeptide (TPR) repeat protein
VPASVENQKVGKVERGRDALLYAIMFVVGIIPYFNTLGFGFAYDDNHQIVNNPYLRSVHYLKQILTTSVWSFKYANIATNYYRPLMSLEYFALYQGYGPLPYIYHLANVVLNAAVVVLLFAVTRRLFRSTQIAFVTAILFAIHPIHTESVSWIADVPDLQLAAFLLLALWFYLDLGDSSAHTWRNTAAMSIFFLLAIFSKEPAIAFPVIATFYEHTCRADRARTSFAEKFKRYAPLWLVAGFYLASRVALMGGLVPKLQRAGLPWGRAIFSSFALFNEYMYKLVWPGHAALFDTFRPSASVFDWAVLCGAAWAIFLCLMAAYFWRRNRLVVVAILWMVATLAPALNARWMATNVFAERYLYLPSIGFCWLVAYGIVALWNAGLATRSKAVRVSLATAAVVLAALLTAQTLVRDRDWRDDLSLFSAAVARNPSDADLRADLGSAYWDSHRESEAIQEWKAALAQNPDSVWALSNLGMAYNQQEKYSESLPLLTRAVELKPQFTDAHLNRAAALSGLGESAEAESEFQTAITGSPLDWNMRNGFGKFLLEAGRLDDAKIQFQFSMNAVANSVALDGLGDIAIRRGETSVAENCFRQAAAFDPYDTHAHFRLAIIYGKGGRNSEAVREYQLALQMDPGMNALGQEAKDVIDSLPKK